jgi:ParB family chromosome partitioning protein
MRPQKNGKSKLLASKSKSGKESLNLGANTRTYLKGRIKAHREEIPWQDISTKTDVHELNPRSREALTLDAVADILPSIGEKGINTEGLAVVCPETGTRLLLDSSRRRFCGIEAKVSLPLWVIDGDIDTKDILSLINDSQEVKRWSYPEHAKYLLKSASLLGIDVDNSTNEELADKLGMGIETLRKRLAAYNVDLNIRRVFVDYEGIPNSYYTDLARIQNKLKKANLNVADTMSAFGCQLHTSEGATIADKQKETLVALHEFVDQKTGLKPKQKEWTSIAMPSFDERYKYVKATQSPDRNKVKIELSRVGADKQKQILDFIKSTLAE